MKAVVNPNPPQSISDDDIVDMQIRWCMTDGGISADDVVRAFRVPLARVENAVLGLPRPHSAHELGGPPEKLLLRAESLLQIMDSPPPALPVTGLRFKPWSWFDAPIVMDFCEESDARIFPDVTPPDLGWGVDVCTAVVGVGDSVLDDGCWYKLQTQRIKRISAESARGLIHQRYAMMPGLYEFGVAAIPKKHIGGPSELTRGTSIVRRIFGYSQRTGWVNAMCSPMTHHARMGDGDLAKASPGSGNNSYVEQDEIQRLGVTLGVQFTAFYEWSVYIRLKQGFMSAGFFVRPGALRDLFKLRDVPDGAKRRAALINWVAGHWRRKTTGDDASWVRKHLRGAKSLSIGDMEVRISPSRDALLEAKGGVR